MADERAVAAEAVADAVKRVADAAVAEVARVSSTKEPTYDVRVSGSPGGKITVYGAGFGTNGTLKVGGHQIKTQEWSSARIVGALPAGVSGEVAVHVDDKTVKKGFLKF